jgi:hypothetical protein
MKSDANTDAARDGRHTASMETAREAPPRFEVTCTPDGREESRRPDDAEAHAWSRHLCGLDQAAREKIDRKFADDLPADGVRRWQKTDTRFEDRDTYERGLYARYPDLRLRPRERVTGDYRAEERTAVVDRDHLNLPTTVAHENLHALSQPGAREVLGSRLHEGMTQHLASEVMPEVHLRGESVGYPDEVRHTEQLAALVGEGPIREAYFRADVSELRQRFDRERGAGAFDAWREAIDREDDEAARRIILGSRE